MAFAFAAVVAASAAKAEELTPKFQEGVSLFLAGDYKGCQRAFSAAVAEAPRAGLAARAAYGAACCAAVRNDVDGGFDGLQLALANGFTDLERALTDPRLDTLRADPRWLRFVTLTQERLDAHQKNLDPDLLRLYLEHREAQGRPDRDLPAATPQGEPTGAVAQSGPARREGATLERAAARRKEVGELVASGRAKRPEDAFHAAAILVESVEPAEVEQAATLARRALAADPDLLAARPLGATAVDRGLMLAGKPQRFGTQIVEQGGSWKLYAVDPSVPDSERAEWGLPPLAQAEARAAELNRAAAAHSATGPAH